MEKIYEYISGSKLYGLDTEKSDTDTRGIYICSNEVLFGLRSRYKEEVHLDGGNDRVVYELQRFMELLLKGNPNIIESLFCPVDKMLIPPHNMLQPLFDHRDMFLTKDLVKLLCRYAHSQISKAQGLNKKIVKPVERCKGVGEFCYVIYEQGSIILEHFLNKHELLRGYVGLVNIPNMQNMYAAYYDCSGHFHDKIANMKYFFPPRDIKTWLLEQRDPSSYKQYHVVKFWEHHFNKDYVDIFDSIEEGTSKGYRGAWIDDGMDVRLSSIPKGEKPVFYMSFNKDGYAHHLREYADYQKWVKNRNPERFRINTEHGKNYDCYFDNETEFFTDKGWKKYDDVLDTDLLGTFDKNRNLIWSKIEDRYSNFYTGKKYTHESRYSKYSITENHNLFLSKGFAPFALKNREHYIHEKSNWGFLKVSDYFKGKYSYYHQIINLQNTRYDNILYSDDFIKLLGMFLSEGTYVFRKNVKIGVRIYQNENKCGTEIMDSIKTIKLNRYVDNRLTVSGNTAIMWDCIDKEILNEFTKCNGIYCYEKDIPDFVYSFSKRQFDLFLKTMLCGDGTKHKEKGHDVYYTTSKLMAETLLTLLTFNGYNSQIYGPYIFKTGFNKNNDFIRPGYQVFISKNYKTTHPINKSLSTKTSGKQKIVNGKLADKNCGWTIEDVENERIVCFTTENNTIITKNSNKLAFHGNSKNTCHCIRLLRMAQELVDGKGFLVDRRDIDREYLLSIKNGEIEYKDFLETANAIKEDVESRVETCNLPQSVDADAVNNILTDIRKSYTKIFIEYGI